jgi:hypothetical protein
MLSAGLVGADVEATGVMRVRAKFSALNTVFTSLIHSKKLVPSTLRGGNIKACNQDSMIEG